MATCRVSLARPLRWGGTTQSSRIYLSAWSRG